MALDATASLYDSTCWKCVTCAASSEPRWHLASNIHLDLLGPATWITFIFFFQELTNVGTLADAGIRVNATRNQIVPHGVMQGNKHLCKTEFF